MEFPEGINKEFLDTLLDTAYPQRGSVSVVRDVQSWQVIGEIQCSSRADAQRSVLRARAIADGWSQTSIYLRSNVMHRFLRRLNSNEQTLVALTQIFSGKSNLDAFEEFAGAVTEIRRIKKTIRRLKKPRRGLGKVPLSHYRVQRKPLGVIGIVSAPEYPLQSIGEVLAPLMSGNAVVQFVPPQVAPVALLLKAFMIDSGMPPDVWRLVFANSIDLCISVVPGFDFVTVSGTDRECDLVERVCRSYSVPVTSYGEVKNVAVVMDDAKIWNTVKAVARAAFHNAGQSGVNIETVFVQDTVLDRFTTLLSRYTRSQLRAGSYRDYFSTVGALLSPERVEHIDQMIRTEVDLGGKIIAGSHPRYEISPTFFEPTIVVNQNASIDMLERRYFGPLLLVVPFSDLADVARILGSYSSVNWLAFFSRDIDLAAAVIEQFRVGMVTVNDTNMTLYTSWKASLHGSKITGMGSRYGEELIEQYTRLFSTSRLRVISWVPKDWSNGNWVERASMASMSYYYQISRWFTDTSMAASMKSACESLRYRIHGPV